MFGGLAFLRGGHMVCGTHRDRGMYRVGKPNEAVALALRQARAMELGGRRMPGMVEVDAEGIVDAALRGPLIALALAFVATLPPK